MSKSIHSLIQTEYDAKHQKALDLLDQKKAAAYSRFPRLQEIENEIQLAGVRFNKAILLGSQSTLDSQRELSLKLEGLKREKQEILFQGGYAKDFLELTFECPLCKDTGFIEEKGTVEKCACYKQKLINYRFSLSNLKLSEDENFSSFDETLFPDDVNEARYGIDISPRQNILTIMERAQEFVSGFASLEDKNLFFSGPTGVGKTFMSNCIAAELIQRGVTVLYQTAPILFNTINEYKMKAFKEEDFQDSGYKNIFEVGLLIIDDLGTEPWSAARYAEFLNILNVRQVNGLSKPCKTIISTNMGIKELYEHYDERVASRIIGGFDIYRFAGVDLRSYQRLNPKESS